MNINYVEDLSRGFVTLNNAWVERWVATLSGYAVSLYIVLKKTAGQKHRCFYGLKSLEKMTGQSRERLLKSIAELEAHGLLIVQRGTTEAGDSATNTYYITKTSADTGEVVRDADHPLNNVRNDEENSLDEMELTISAVDGGVVRRTDHVVRDTDKGSTRGEPGLSATRTGVVRQTDSKQIQQNSSIQTDTLKTTTPTAPSPESVASKEDSVVVFDSKKSNPNPIIEEMVAVSVTKKDATQLLTEFGEAACRHQLDCLQYRDARNKGVMLVRSIREDWSDPDGYTEAKQAEARRQKRLREAVEAQKQQAAAKAAQNALEQAWEALSSLERTRYEELVRQHYASLPMGVDMLARKDFGDNLLHKKALEIFAAVRAANLARAT